MDAVVGLNVDLHSHSTMSDGVLAPADVAGRAGVNGVQVWSLTDHDEVAGLPEAQKAAQEAGMQFVPGVEVSVTWARRTIHILGLGIDFTEPELVAGLSGIRTRRVERAKEMAKRLDDAGVPDSYEGALPYATNPSSISRTHFARFLVAKGYCKNMRMAFDKYLGDNKSASVPLNWSTLEEVISWINGAGGRAVIAHPGRYGYSAIEFDALFNQFKQMGGVAIEVITGSHFPNQYREYADVARHYGFLASCGSDFHSPSESRVDLGALPRLPAGVKPVWHDWV
ncbi:MAG: PHP domain-containing protein [Burkholderiaceae bacterium]